MTGFGEICGLVVLAESPRRTLMNGSHLLEREC